jgi:hypothetical protein
VSDTAKELAALNVQVEKALGEKAAATEKGESKEAHSAAERISRLRAEQKNANRETKYFPLWKPLQEGVDYGEGSYSQEAYASVVPNLMRQFEGDRDIRKAITSDYAGPLIRQDLEAEVNDVFVHRFPLWDMIEKIPANGLVHAWNNQTSVGQATGGPGMSELGSVQDTNATYQRLTQNIAIFAVRVGISLKAKFAVNAGGMGYDPEQREIRSGVIQLTQDVQREMCRYQNVLSGSTTSTDPNGAYDANGFNGLRFQAQNLAPSGNNLTLSVSGYPPAVETHPLTDKLQTLANTLIDAGADPSGFAVVTNYTGRQYLIEEQTSFVRFNDPVEVKPGVMVPKIILADGIAPIFAIPGDSIGSWTLSGHNYTDMFLVHMDSLKWAFLGGAAATILDIPIGTDGKLQHLYIPFMMGSLVVEVPQFLGRLSLQTS